MAKEKEGLRKENDSLAKQFTEGQSSVFEQIEQAKRPLEEQIVGLETDINRKGAIIEEKEKQLVTLHQERERLTQEFDLATKERERLQGRLILMSTDLEVMESSISEQILQVRRPLEDRIVALAGEIKETRDDFQAKEKQLAEVIAEKENLNQQMVFLQQDKDKLAREISRTEASVETRIFEAKRPLQEEVKGLITQLNGAESMVSQRFAQIKKPLEERISRGR